MKVRMAVKALLYDKFSDLGLLGQVFYQDKAKGDVYICNISLPMVDYASERMRIVTELSDAKPGKYLLQISLANGDVMTEDFEIMENKDTELVVTLPHEGPHEWTTLHALKGTFKQTSAPIEQVERSFYKPGLLKGHLDMSSLEDSPGSYSELSMDPENGYSLSILSSDVNPGGDIFGNNQTIGSLSSLIQQDLDVESAEEQLGNISKIELAAAAEEDNNYLIFKFGHSGAPVARRYLIQKSAQGGTLICLPTPWMMPNGPADVEILIDKRRIAGELDYSMTISDPMINSVLGYINSGAIHKAVALVDFEHAKRMLFDKISYPLAASIGGYLLVLSMDRESYQSDKNNWKDWVVNLDNWFEWLPDGAILHCAMNLMSVEHDKQEAYNALMRAYDRGLPFFTFGLKLMIDGMRYFSNEGNELARQHLSELETIALHVDPEQPFLSVNFSSSWEANKMYAEALTLNA